MRRELAARLEKAAAAAVPSMIAKPNGVVPLSSELPINIKIKPASS